MTTRWDVVLSVLGGLLMLWLALVLVLWIEQRRHPGGASLRDLLRLAPDVARLLKRLAADRTVSIGVRIWLAVLFLYLLSPIDLIPDFIPVLGYADDAIVVAIALRFATRRAGSDAVKRHRPGTPEGLSAVLRLSGLNPLRNARSRTDAKPVEQSSRRSAYGRSSQDNGGLNEPYWRARKRQSGAGAVKCHHRRT